MGGTGEIVGGTGDSRFKVGEHIPGSDWVVTGVLGRGGMGLVLDVEKPPGLCAAVKVLLPRFAESREVTRRFEREVAVLASLRHENIVRVMDWKLLPDKTPYIVMERLFGTTLRSVAQGLAAAGDRLLPRDVWYIARHVCEGLYVAHTNQPTVVHRDLKPDNIFLHEMPLVIEPVVKIIDFGVAEVLDQVRRQTQRKGLTIGTPKYMAPEVFRSERVGPKADLYAIALIVYELLTGRSPWDVNDRNMAEVMDAHMRVEPKRVATFVPGIPKTVDDALMQALSKYPDERQADVLQLARALIELQWVGDCSDANTTAPTLGTFTQVAWRKATRAATAGSATTTPGAAAQKGAAELAGEEGAAQGGPPHDTVEEARQARPASESVKPAAVPSDVASGVSEPTTSGVGMPRSRGEARTVESAPLEASASIPLGGSPAGALRAGVERFRHIAAGFLAGGVLFGAAMFGLGRQGRAPVEAGPPPQLLSIPTEPVPAKSAPQAVAVPSTSMLEAPPASAAATAPGPEAIAVVPVEGPRSPDPGKDALPNLGVVPLALSPASTPAAKTHSSPAPAKAPGQDATHALPKAAPPQRAASTRPRPAPTRDDGMDLISVPQ